MEQQIEKSLLLEQGYCVLENIFDHSTINAIENKHAELIPQRGHGIDNKYWPKDTINDCPELALWWSQQVTDWPEVKEISDVLLAKIGYLFEDSNIYVADVISNTPKNQYIKPHIDSPYRFDEWHNSNELLGVQCIIPLCEFTKSNGGTGLLPGSHKKNWIVKESYKGTYNEEFLNGVIQPAMGIGDALVYHPRVLHSTMPNTTNSIRRALLIHITSNKMIVNMKKVDNIWLDIANTNK